MGQLTHIAIGWSLVTRWSDRILGIVSISILARLLTPQDFGLVALATLTQGAIEVLFAFGFDWALVQHRAPTQAHYDAAWSIRLLCAVGSALLLSLAAPLVAWTFNEPRVIAVMLTLSVVILIRSLENPYMAALRRQMDFHKEMVVRTTGKVAGLIAAALIAFTFNTYWALPIGMLVSATAETASSYAVHRGRPAWGLAKSRDLLRFSVWVLLSGIVLYIRERLGAAVVGRTLGNAPLAFFSLAQELSNLASSELSAPLNRVLFSTYSRAANDPDQIKDAFLLAAYSLWLIGFPATAGVALIAPELVLVLLGSQWIDAVPVLQLLCVANAVTLLVSSSGMVFLSANRGTTNLAIMSTSAAALLIALWLFVPTHGLQGAALAQVVSALAAVPITFLLLARVLPLAPRDLLRGLWRPSIGCAVMAATVVLARLVAEPADSELLTLIFCILMGAASYTVTVLALWVAAGRPAGSELALLTAVGARLGWSSLEAK